MKKLICFILIVLVIVLIGKNNYYVIPDEAIRFRIIPNSNSVKDVVMKEKVQMEITDIIDDVKSDSIDESRKKIIENIDLIERRIDRVFESNDYKMDYSVNYGINKFPKKVYNGVKYNEGEYESLVVSIGKGKGDNFWCVLYPPLCMIDESEEVKYKFKVIELFNKLFS